ncbi:MAG: hypothetical protein QOH48_1260 [Actinomycetota bacterium]|jgi:hypothetical protein|nr:hypothetical protein [Actinomycetota bacterium]
MGAVCFPLQPTRQSKVEPLILEEPRRTLLRFRAHDLNGVAQVDRAWY